MSQVYQIITDRILEQIQSGKTAPWVKPWKGGAAGMAKNATTGKAYRGINAFILGMASHEYPTANFLTFKQCQAAGGMVRKGQHGLPVTFWGETAKKDSDETYRFLRYYTVFNVAQCDGLPAEMTAVPDLPPPNRIESLSAADALVIGYVDRPKVSHVEGSGRALYRPLTDEISLPAPEQFETAPHYYATLFHELAHSTGHASRLDREGITAGGFFGDHRYSFEELVAEFTAAYLCGISGIETEDTFRNSAAYLDNWTKALKGNPTWLVKAAGHAQKAADYMRGIEAYKVEETQAA